MERESMLKKLELTFHNQGLRSYIELDLCAECPRQDDKGCCGYYSPVFYPCDFAYLLQHKPEVLDYIFSLDNLTILDASVTVNNRPEGQSYRCNFHSKTGGCLLPQALRESVCRHFVCPGVAWEKEDKLAHWKDFFAALTDYEIELNNRIAGILKEKGLSLREEKRRDEFMAELLILFEQETATTAPFLAKCPPLEKYSLFRELQYGTDWPL